MPFGKILDVASNFVPGLGAAKTAMNVIGGLGGGGGGGGAAQLGGTYAQGFQLTPRNKADLDVHNGQMLSDTEDKFTQQETFNDTFHNNSMLGARLRADRREQADNQEMAITAAETERKKGLGDLKQALQKASQNA